MSIDQMWWWLVGTFAAFGLLGLWLGWEIWGRQRLRTGMLYAEANTKIMLAGYRVSLQRTVEALELWERTRGAWKLDGSTTVPAATSMALANALGYARTALLADAPPTQQGGAHE